MDPLVLVARFNDVFAGDGPSLPGATAAPGPKLRLGPRCLRLRTQRPGVSEKNSICYLWGTWGPIRGSFQNKVPRYRPQIVPTTERTPNLWKQPYPIHGYLDPQGLARFAIHIPAVSSTLVEIRAVKQGSVST